MDTGCRQRKSRRLFVLKDPLTLLDLFHKRRRQRGKRKHSSGETGSNFSWRLVWQVRKQQLIHIGEKRGNCQNMSTGSEFRVNASFDVTMLVNNSDFCAFVLPPSALLVATSWGRLVTESAASSPHPEPVLSEKKNKTSGSLYDVRLYKKRKKKKQRAVFFFSPCGDLWPVSLWKASSCLRL